VSSDFVQLHVHSEYSLDIGFFCVDDYVKFCYENNISMASITERFNLCSIVKFYKKCIEFGIKPIIGCEFFVDYGLNGRSKILLLCQNLTGYRNLTKIIAKAYLNNLVDGIPVINRRWFLSLSEGLIVIGLAFESDIGKCLLSGNYLGACSYLKFWKKVFGNRYYLSVTKLGLEIEFIFYEHLFDFLEKNDVFLLSTNEVCFLRSIELLAYRSKIAIFDPDERVVLDISDSYFKNRYFKLYDEMFSIFSDMPEVLDNSFEVGKRCNLILDFSKDYAPKYLKKIEVSTEAFLVKISVEKLFEKLFVLDKRFWFIYIQRLEMELGVINRVGFANYFLVTHDFIVWAKQNDVLVGPGRGSGSGSLVAYLLSITDIDPIKYDLLFERFLNYERITSPDFDIDFCIESRDLVIDYIFDEYGFNNVAQIITFGCMTIKAVIRDVGRVLGYSYGFVNKVIKLVSGDFGLSLKSELLNNPELKSEYDASYDIQAVFNMSLKLEGIVKGIGKHAGGLVISPFSLLGFLPLSYDSDDYSFMTQLDKIDAEAFGFVKFDFLGLKTLSIMSTVIETVLSYDEMEDIPFFDLEVMNLYDKRTYFLIQSADTIGIFQFESVGIKSVIQKIKPDVFSDIVALVALYRPGPLQSGMLYSFLLRKIGLEPIDYIHPRLESVLRETHGIVVYQEQVMLIAQVFSNYSISSADFLRIAMSKKNVEDMNVHLELFSQGAEVNGIDRATSREVYFIVEKFAGYGFNKAHSVGYALLAYNSAWLKANYNTIFLSTLLSSDMYNHDNVSLYINECVHFGIKIFLPDINRSFYCFTISDNSIYYGLGSLPGVGLSIISEIVHNRCYYGPYNCFFDFLHRIDINLLSKKTLQSLIYSGVFDKLYKQRFKLVLISFKILDLYFKLESSSLYIMSSSFVDDYFNHMVKNMSYMIEYKQHEIRQQYDLISGLTFNNFFYFYKYDINLISKLSFNDGVYFNMFLCGVIEGIKFKRVYYERHVVLNIIGYNKVYELLISYFRYKSFGSLLKKGNFIVFIGYNRKNFLCEILVENFYLFRYKYVKYLDFVFYNSFISDVFLKHFFVYLSKKFISGNSTIRFKVSIGGKYRYIFFDKKFKIALHDDFIFFFSKMKEIKTIERVYSF